MSDKHDKAARELLRGGWVSVTDIASALRQAAADERAACAKEADYLCHGISEKCTIGGESWLHRVAANIRARGTEQGK